MTALLRMLVASLCALTLALVPVFGDEGLAGEGGVINLPGFAATSQNRGMAMSAPARAPLLVATRSTLQPLKLGLPETMRPAVVWVINPQGGSVMLPVQSGTFYLSPRTMRALMNVGIHKLRLHFLSAGGLSLTSTLDFDPSSLTVTVTVP